MNSLVLVLQVKKYLETWEAKGFGHRRPTSLGLFTFFFFLFYLCFIILDLFFLSLFFGPS